MNNEKCSKCKNLLYTSGRSHSYKNKMTGKLFCKFCAISKKHNNKAPNPETFERIKKESKREMKKKYQYK